MGSLAEHQLNGLCVPVILTHAFQLDKRFLSTYCTAGSGLGIGAAKMNEAEVPAPPVWETAKEMLSRHGGRAPAEEGRTHPCTGRGRRDVILPPEIPAKSPGRCLGFPPFTLLTGYPDKDRFQGTSQGVMWGMSPVPNPQFGAFPYGVHGASTVNE